MAKEDTQFKPGSGGRPKGVPNKITRAVKEHVLDVFNQIQEHPKANLYQFAVDNPGQFYAIAKALIPTEIQAKVQSASFSLNITPMAGCEPIKPLTDGKMDGNTGD